MPSNKDDNFPRDSEGQRIALPPSEIPFPSCRLILSFYSFFGFLVIYSLRNNLSVAIVAMVNTTYINELDAAAGKNHSAAESCPGEKPAHNITDGVFKWDSYKQNIVLGGFYYGYLTTQFPGGVLAQRFGGKLLLLFGIFWTSLLTLLTPVFTEYGDFPAIVATRILEGIGEGVTFPAMHFLISQWAAPFERSKMVTFVYAGAQIGTVITNPISGALSQYVNWIWVFYVFGALGVVWSVLWIFFAYNSPATHPRISPIERDYIAASQGHQTKASLNAPWFKIFTSPPVYAVVIGHFTHNWGYYTLLICLPQYLKFILKFDIKDNGLIAGAPYIVLWAAMILSGFFADYLRTRRILTTTSVRKIFTAVGFILPACLLVGTGYVNCNRNLAVFLIILSVGLSGISWAGWSVNHLDLAPPYAGALMALTNTVATIPGFVSPVIVGAMTDKGHTRKAWRSIFYIAGAIYIAGTIFFVIFGSGKRQPWAIEPSAKVEVAMGDDAPAPPPPPPPEAAAETQRSADVDPEKEKSATDVTEDKIVPV